MPWCPVCKNEYAQDMTHCPDCDMELSEDFELPEPSKTYKSPESRYSEMRSSAFIFLLIGVIGLIVMALCWLDILPLPVYDFVLFVLTAMFVLFLGISISSFRSAKKIKATIASENAFLEEVMDWYHTTGCKSPLFNEIDPDQPQEMLYFQKSESIRSLLTEQFPEIDEALLEKLTDDFCEEDFNN